MQRLLGTRRSQYKTCASLSSSWSRRYNSRKTSWAISSAAERSNRQCSAMLKTIAWCSRNNSGNGFGPVVAAGAVEVWLADIIQGLSFPFLSGNTAGVAREDAEICGTAANIGRAQ